MQPYTHAGVYSSLHTRKHTYILARARNSLCWGETETITITTPLLPTTTNKAATKTRQSPPPVIVSSKLLPLASIAQSLVPGGEKPYNVFKECETRRLQTNKRKMKVTPSETNMKTPLNLKKYCQSLEERFGFEWQQVEREIAWKAYK